MKIKLRLSALVLSALILSSCSVSRIDSGNDATTEPTPAQTVKEPTADSTSSPAATETTETSGETQTTAPEETTTDHSGAGVISGGVEFIGTKYTRAELKPSITPRTASVPASMSMRITARPAQPCFRTDTVSTARHL